jgi:hypothetical protein
MTINEFFKYRQELLDLSCDENNFLQEPLLLSQVLPSMLDAKLIDSEDYTSSYFILKPEKLKVNGYSVNESGERLQLFIIDETSLDIAATEDSILRSTKADYESQFKRCSSFLNKAIKGHLNDEIQDSSPIRPLISKISSTEGIEQFDVFEIFLISATATVSLQGASPQPKRIDFESESITTKRTVKNVVKDKEIIIKKRLIDLNFLFNIMVSQGNREALEVNFNEMFGAPITALKAADEEHFESYLCILPATILSGLYKEFSSRLLEKNVRSFLQFKGVNKGIRETIRLEPEKFIAYNNGITITATGADIVSENGQVQIKSLQDFQIVNGGQTTATIYFTQKDGFDVSKIKVMAKVNVAKGDSEEDLEELISNISNFSNAQSRVSKVDLRSRNPQLIKLKSLSDSVLSPSGQKWFFERSKGEFNTMVRIAGSNKARILREYPKNCRFSKEQLAKYYTAWGDQPHIVKKGGEKVFRYFIEDLSGEGKSKKTQDINRLFFEELIAKVILFTELEKIYGVGKKSIGQIRAAVIPYSLSVIFKYTDGTKSADNFDLIKVWKSEGLTDDLRLMFEELLVLMNDLVKAYSKSDDINEYSKKEELWKTISECSEVKKFLRQEHIIKILNTYSISKNDTQKRFKKETKIEYLDLDSLRSMADIFANSEEFYIKLKQLGFRSFNPQADRKIGYIIASIKDRKDLSKDLVKFEHQFIKKLRFENPELFDLLEDLPRAQHISKGMDLITKTYNDCLENSLNIISEFQKIDSLFQSKGVKYASVYSAIGTKLHEGTIPSIKDVIYSSEKFKTEKILLS